MIIRKHWQSLIETRWSSAPIVWMSGVRRSGKTFLAKSLENVEYLDCERPRTRARLSSPEDFLESVSGKRLVIDEIHRLDNPSELLKIAADHYPTVRILATGSSTLGASAKFRDTLVGRKTNVWLTPMNLQDTVAFGGGPDLRHRLLRGGLPPLFEAADFDDGRYQDWLDAYWAKDVQGLFPVGQREAFIRLAELLLIQSGGMFVASSFAGPCGITHPTVMNYLDVLEETYVVHVVRPYATHKATEVISAPKVYGFDTGFVCFFRGWHELRESDLGYLWEDLVLNEIHAAKQTRSIYYWRDKQKHEIDFVWAQRGGDPIAIECKWSAKDFDPSNLRIFRRYHPEGDNLVVCHDVEKGFAGRFKDLNVRFESLPGLIERLKKAGTPMGVIPRPAAEE